MGTGLAVTLLIALLFVSNIAWVLIYRKTYKHHQELMKKEYSKVELEQANSKLTMEINTLLAELKITKEGLETALIELANEKESFAGLEEAYAKIYPKADHWDSLIYKLKNFAKEFKESHKDCFRTDHTPLDRAVENNLKGAIHGQ